MQKGEPARCVEQQSRDINFNARNEDRSAQGAAARKGNPRGSPQRPLEGIHGKTEKWRLCSHGPRMVSVREEIRAASSTILTEKKVHPVLLPLKRERTQEVTEKETPKGKDPKVSVRQESQTRRYATIKNGAQCRT